MKSFTEKQLQEQLQKDTPIPDVVEKKVHQAYLQIQSGQISQVDEKSQHRPGLCGRRFFLLYDPVSHQPGHGQKPSRNRKSL